VSFTAPVVSERERRRFHGGRAWRFCVAIGFACLIQGALAATLLDEFFDYPDGPLVTVSDGKWVTHSGTTGQVSVVSGRALLTQADSEDVNALLAGQPYAANSDTVLYAGFNFSFSALPSSSGTYFAHFKDHTLNGYRAKIFAVTAGAAPGQFRLGIANFANSVNATIASDLSLHTEYRAIVRYVVSNATSTLWLNPTSELDGAVVASDAASALPIAGFAFRQTGGMGALAVNDLTVGQTFAAVHSAPPINPPVIAQPPASQSVIEGEPAIFHVVATGSDPLTFQWEFNGVDLPGATNATLSLDNVTVEQAGDYSVQVSNAGGSTNSPAAALVVIPIPEGGTVSFVTYNVKGNFASDWTTNAAQVQAIGRKLRYLDPDIVTFNEIPASRTYEMTNFVPAYLPGYFMATNSGTDGAIRSVILSRYPITRSESWLARSGLTNFGYDGVFTRDLFEAEIRVPGATEPLHVFTTHLKSGSSTDDTARRSAEARAISNFFATVFLPADGARPYVLTGDLNEDIARPPSSTQQCIVTLANAVTGLRLTTPINPFSGSELTFSIQSSNGLTRRYDYILPSGILFSNIAGSQVFRTDLLPGPPAPLESTDSFTASDHLPVVMTFYYPDPPLHTALEIVGSTLTLRWPTLIGRQYNVESASEPETWTVAASNVTATSSFATWSTTLSGNARFFRVVRVP
jgi:endonuclease/exonuclease/phosphatase family metal-dependent hydrolase